MNEWKNWIGGKWADAASGDVISIRNPASPEQVVSLSAQSDQRDVEKAVHESVRAFQDWKKTPPGYREQLLRRFADLLERHLGRVAQIVTLEQGKALAEAKGEVMKAVQETRFMAGEVPRLRGITALSDRPNTLCYTLRIPLGPIAAINPWNFPVSTPLRKAIPALASGNTVIIKPADLTPGASAILMELFAEAGFPDGTVNMVLGKGSKVGSALVEAKGIAGVSFTGSTEVGRVVYQMAASRLIPVQLEMGGKNAAIVCKSADLKQAADDIISAALLCSGQRCTAISRVLVQEDVADQFSELLVERLNSIKVGPGMDAGIQMGPLVSQTQLLQVDGWVRRGVEQGARIRSGGYKLTEPGLAQGYFYAPTLIDTVTPDMEIAQEEIFGPVLTLTAFKTVEDAVRITNDVKYGLTSAIFTKELAEADFFIEFVETGMVHVNHGTAPQGHMPFGGVKESGVGAFSVGSSAIEFFTTTKTIYRQR